MSSTGPSDRGANSASQFPARIATRSSWSTQKDRTSDVLPTPASPATTTVRPRRVYPDTLEALLEHRQLAASLEKIERHMRRRSRTHRSIVNPGRSGRKNSRSANYRDVQTISVRAGGAQQASDWVGALPLARTEPASATG